MLYLFMGKAVWYETTTKDTVIPLIKNSKDMLWYFLCSYPGQDVEQTTLLPIWDTMTLVSSL